MHEGVYTPSSTAAPTQPLAEAVASIMLSPRGGKNPATLPTYSGVTSGPAKHGVGFLPHSVASTGTRECTVSPRYVQLWAVLLPLCLGEGVYNRGVNAGILARFIHPDTYRDRPEQLYSGVWFISGSSPALISDSGPP